MNKEREKEIVDGEIVPFDFWRATNTKLLYPIGVSIYLVMLSVKSGKWNVDFVEWLKGFKGTEKSWLDSGSGFGLDD